MSPKTKKSWSSASKAMPERFPDGDKRMSPKAKKLPRQSRYTAEVQSAYEAKSRQWRKLSTYGNYRSAQTTAYMVRHGRTLTAFEQYPPGTFEAKVRNEREVWFRRA
jgi:hypothetical protein